MSKVYVFEDDPLVYFLGDGCMDFPVEMTDAQRASIEYAAELWDTAQNLLCRLIREQEADKQS
jgi:hypothetical protein